MSLIDQALKKTQFSLNQQKSENNAKKASVNTVRLQTFKQISRNPLQQKRYSQKTLPAINGYLLWSLLGLILLVLASFYAHLNYSTIAKRYINFYGTIFFDKNTPIQAKSTRAKLEITNPTSIVLDGTVEVGNEWGALINNKLYTTHEMVNGYQIVQIRFNHVSLLNPTTNQSIELTSDFSH